VKVFAVTFIMFLQYLLRYIIFLYFRNEKCLSSIAAGNWLLRKSYLEACRKAGYFVDEEPHEWGVEIPGESLTSLGVASRKWRTVLAKVTALKFVNFHQGSK
jgi:hypothetical protein